MSNRHICHNLTFFFNDTATTEIYTLSLHDALPISRLGHRVFLKWKSNSAGKQRRKLSVRLCQPSGRQRMRLVERSEEHTSELQSPDHLVFPLLLEKKKKNNRSLGSIMLSLPLSRVV